MDGAGSIGVVAWRTAPGLLPYPEALDAMRARAAGIRAGAAGELVWLVEHPPLYTAGTSARAEELTDPDRFPTFDAGRGGQWTYHGPGQRTAYVMLDLGRGHGLVRPRDVRSLVWGLEEWLIRALRRLDVAGERREGRVGIWVADPAGGERRQEAKSLGGLYITISAKKASETGKTHSCPAGAVGEATVHRHMR